MGLRIPTSTSLGVGKLNTINEATPGNIPSTSPALRLGQLGQEMEFESGASGPSVLDGQLYDSSIGTLYSGRYMYVQLDSAAALNSVRGGVAFISTLAKWGAYVVTSDSATAATLLRPVGIFLGVVTIGNYCWIQTAGLATLKFATDVTNPADGSLVKIVDQSGIGVGQQVSADLTANVTLALVSAYTAPGIVAAELPVDNTLTRVFLNPMAKMY